MLKIEHDKANGVLHYPSLDNATYHADRSALSRSVVSTIAKGGTLTAKWQLDNPQAPTDAMSFGSAFHCALDPNDDFDTKYRRGAPGARNTKGYKEAQAVLEEMFPGANFIRPDDWQALKDMRQRVYSNKGVDQLLRGEMLTEHSFFWEETYTGVMIKCRPDLICVDQGVIIDWKTTTDASPFGFNNSVKHFRYYLQAPWYLQGVEKYFGREFTFVFVAVEKSPPYNVAIYSLPRLWHDAGLNEIRTNLDKWANAVGTGEWVAYPEEIVELSIPRYLQEALEAE